MAKKVRTGRADKAGRVNRTARTGKPERADSTVRTVNNLSHCGFYPANSSFYTYRCASFSLHRPYCSTEKSTTTMATYSEGSSDYVYTSVPMSKSSSSSSSSSNTPTITSSVKTSPLQELKGFKDHLFLGIDGMQYVVKSQRDEFETGNSNQQYLIFKHVSPDDLVKIDGARKSMGKIRIAYYPDMHLLIVKIPTAEHEAAASNIGCKMVSAFTLMGIPDYEVWAVGSQTYRAPTSSKEADIAYRPSSFRNSKDAWPTIVFEVGASESLGGLRWDARWWLRETGGDVKIVILIHIHRERKRLDIEKWELVPAPVVPSRATRANPNPPLLPPLPPIPTMMREITIVPVTTTPNTVVGPPFTITGAPLVLEFHKILLRPANPPRETDITFTVQDLENFATFFWRNVS
jgi:hypothetical protein